MSSDAIRIEGLSKRYRLGAHQPYRRLGESVLRLGRRLVGRRTARSERQILWALKDVSFNVAAGEIVGIIGANGAGKTTLLRILSRITRPTSGRAEIFGRVGSLLEVGTGFHPELTGRENVFLNGAILGMGRKEIAQKYNQIVAFAQIDEFMETQVKHYSSGMRVRLAFSVAAHLEPEILFIDEVLAVGDAAFQQKCLGKMEEVASAGRTVIFVSHNMGMVTGLCTRCVWIDHGTVRMDGDPQSVVEAYLSQEYSSEGRWVHPENEDCGEDLRFTSAEIVGADGEITPAVPFDEPLRIRMNYEARTFVRDVVLGFKLGDMSGNVILASTDVDADPTRGEWEPGRYSVTCTIPGSTLRPGRYLISLVAKKRRGIKLDEHRNCLGVEVAPIRFTIQANRQGIITPMLPWSEPSRLEVGT